jgi:AraC family transcriptional regulator, regulatory protein of adaptative response / methylated-DNA-[protein]-cysteine methyltransferase
MALFTGISGYDLVEKLVESSEKKLHSVFTASDNETELQNLFHEWAKIPADRFFFYSSPVYAGSLINSSDPGLFDYPRVTGMELNRSKVLIRRMTEKELQHNGADLKINYSFGECLFGRYLVASTAIGICYLAFLSSGSDHLDELRANFKLASITESPVPLHQVVKDLLNEPYHFNYRVTLHLKCTPFQLKVWEQLLDICFGTLNTYGNIAQVIGSPGAFRAVGTAVGANPVAYLIPCHRVVNGNGKYGAYRWGSLRKRILIAYEASKCYQAIAK